MFSLTCSQCRSPLALRVQTVESCPHCLRSETNHSASSPIHVHHHTLLSSAPTSNDSNDKPSTHNADSLKPLGSDPLQTPSLLQNILSRVQQHLRPSSLSIYSIPSSFSSMCSPKNQDILSLQFKTNILCSTQKSIPSPPSASPSQNTAFPKTLPTLLNTDIPEQSNTSSQKFDLSLVENKIHSFLFHQPLISEASSSFYKPQTQLHWDISPAQLISIRIESFGHTQQILLPALPPFVPENTTVEQLTLLAKTKHFRRKLYLWAKWGYPNPRNPAWMASRQLLEILPQPPTLHQKHRILTQSTETPIPIILDIDFPNPQDPSTPQRFSHLKHVWEKQNRPHGDWTFIGPRNVGGRINKLAVSPQDPLHVLAGTATGGVWETRDGGRTWRSLFDTQITQAVGAVAFGSTPNVIYVGTGDPVGEKMEGRGVFKSVDGGKTWLKTSLFPGANPNTTIDPTSQVLNIRSILIVPGSNDIVFVCSNAGSFCSLSGGNSWQIVEPPAPENSPTDDPQNTGQPWEIVWHHELGKPPKVWIALGGGNGSSSKHPMLVCYTLSLKFLPQNLRHDPIKTPPRLVPFNNAPFYQITWEDNVGKARIAIHPTQQHVMYACYGTVVTITFPNFLNAKTKSECFVLFRSNDSGNTWSHTAIVGAGQVSDYDLSLGVDPDDPTGNTVWVGGQAIYQSTDGGKTFNQGFEINEHKHDAFRTFYQGKNPPPHLTGLSIGVHSDIHDIVFVPSSITQQSGGVVYVATDGGLYSSTDKGQSWRSCSLGLGCTQFYVMGASQSGSALVGGALQDNGTLLSYGGLTFHHILDGDGGTFAISPTEHTRVIFDHQDPGLFLSDDAGLHKHSIEDRQGQMRAQGGYWEWPTVFCPSGVIYVAVDGVFRSTDEGKSWEQISTDMLYSHDAQGRIRLDPSNNPIYLNNFARRIVDPRKRTRPTSPPEPEMSAPLDPGFVAPNDKERKFPAGRVVDMAVSKDENTVVVGMEGERLIFRGQRSNNGFWEWQKIQLPVFVDGDPHQPVQAVVRAVALTEETTIDQGQPRTLHHIYALTQKNYDGDGARGWQHRSHIFFIPEGATQDNNIVNLTGLLHAPATLPDREIAFIILADPWEPKIFYVGTESGVYVCHRDEGVWRTLGGYLPRVPCFDLKIDPVAGLLRVGTYGRGLWEIPVGPNMDSPPAMLYLRDHICDPGRGTSPLGLRDPSRPSPDPQNNQLPLKRLYWWESPDIKIDSGQRDEREISRYWGDWETEDPARYRIARRQTNSEASIVSLLRFPVFNFLQTNRLRLR